VKICLFDDYRLGVVEGDQVADVTHVLIEHDPEWPWVFVPRFIRDFDQYRVQITAHLPSAPRKPLSQVRLRPPVPAPFNIAAAASNYKDHQAEMNRYSSEGRFTGGQQTAGLGYGSNLASGLPSVEGRPEGTRGEVFLKSTTSIIGPNETILLPDTVPGKEVHHEGEFAAVIQKECYRVSRQDALSYVFGYMGLMDITVRGDGDRSRRKSYKSFTPVGPWITTRDEIANPQNVKVRLWVNDDLRQDAHTSNQIEGLAEVIEYASHCYPLMPGDIVTTGSPAGVGQIHEGDKVKLEVEGVGSFTVDVERI
jgi:2-keto-4-pentenoate hydratase/2-oxohepta-3-ene-1,7-dioic acid hydratase in catechol pathway